MAIDLKTNFNARVLNLENQYDIKRELININADKRAFDGLVANMEFMHIRLEQVDTRAANIIKQVMIRIGGEAAISEEAYSYTTRTTNMLISASRKNMGFLAKKLASKQYELEDIAKEIERCIDEKHGALVVGKKTFDFNHTVYLSGVVEYRAHLFGTPVSEKTILNRIERFQESGIDMIELFGGYVSSNKHNQELPAEDKEFLSKIIILIRKKFPDLIISVDAIKLELAKIAVDAGVDMINNIIPIRYNLDLLKFLSKNNLPMILMYAPNINRLSEPLAAISDVIRDIQANVNYAISNGISKEKIIIDPSICFGRKDKDNFLLLRQLSSFRYLKMPLSITISRKSFLGLPVLSSMKKLQISTVISNILAIINSTNIIRLENAEQISIIRNILELIHPTVKND